MKISLLGIDLAKAVFQLHGVDEFGKPVLRKRLARAQVLSFLANLPKCLVGMEACGGSNYWAREIQKLGHEVRLIPAQFVKPFVKSNKNDAADAEAICEALSRPSMRFVPVKSVDQQDIQFIHRVRSRLIRSRTALMNEIRSLLHENGIVLPQSARRLRSELPLLIAQADQRGLTVLFQETLQDLQTEFLALDQRIEEIDRKIDRIFKAHPVARQLTQIPGVGPLTATAFIAASHPQAFKNGRQFSAWIGLVPRQYSSGGREKLLGMSKRGDAYLRTLLIHGARAVLQWADKKNDRRSEWAKQIKIRRGMNRAAVALANKNARIIWVILAQGKEFQLQSA